MVFDVLVIATVVGAVWWWQRRPRPARHFRGTRREDCDSGRAYEDLPPIGAFDPVPDEDDLEEYASAGIENLERYLSGWDRTL
ncbi:MAG: hypothetical protein QG622_524 [Actinomycetota bacterium]|nr:hypothetical protein [Actinomycetota bacterium]